MRRAFGLSQALQLGLWRGVEDNGGAENYGAQAHISSRRVETSPHGYILTINSQLGTETSPAGNSPREVSFPGVNRNALRFSIPRKFFHSLCAAIPFFLGSQDRATIRVLGPTGRVNDAESVVLSQILPRAKTRRHFPRERLP